MDKAKNNASVNEAYLLYYRSFVINQFFDTSAPSGCYVPIRCNWCKNTPRKHQCWTVTVSVILARSHPVPFLAISNSQKASSLSLHYIFQTWQSSESPNSTPEGDRDTHHIKFFIGNLILNNFNLKHFSI